MFFTIILSHFNSSDGIFLQIRSVGCKLRPRKCAKFWETKTISELSTSASPPRLGNPYSPSGGRDWQISSSNTQGKSQLENKKFGRNCQSSSWHCFSKYQGLLPSLDVGNFLLTPEWHEHSVKNSSWQTLIPNDNHLTSLIFTWMVKKVSYPCVVTDLVEGPGTAVGALWAHCYAEISQNLIKAHLTVSSFPQKYFRTKIKCDISEVRIGSDTKPSW